MEGFTLYGPYHLVWLGVTLLLVCSSALIYRQRTLLTKTRTKRYLAWGIIIGEIIKDIYVLLFKTLTVEELPFSLCGLAMFFILWHSYTNNQTIGNMLFCLFLPGALSAMLFCNWTERPVASFQSIFSFLYHIALIVYISIILFTKEVRPNPKHLWAPVVFLLMTAPLLYRFNKAYDTNFMFLNTPSPGSPLIPLEHIFGNPGYIFGLVLVLLGVWVVMYVPYMLRQLAKIMMKKRVKAH